ncbi:MAG: class I SAM-dependent methyltransferase [Desulfobacterales bacterium]|nr:class I SAM-dependent methyltransferase [Desulfobacterales bacterium]MCP4162472.1 class I SAM-dependent methyltransferase [Deltaproteobacteria bacterium]
MEEQKKYWDKVSDTKKFTTPFRMDLFKSHVSKNCSVLDFGCGYGRILSELRSEGFDNLTGVDYSIDMIKRGKADLPEIKLIHSTSGKLPFKNDSFDAVTVVAVLTCIVDDEALEKTVDELKRVLKPNGIIYINDFLINSDLRNKKRYEKYQGHYPYGVFRLPEGALLRHFDKKRLIDLLKAFNTITFDELLYTTMNGNKSNGFYYMGQLV